MNIRVYDSARNLEWDITTEDKNLFTKLLNYFKRQKKVVKVNL